MNMHGLELPLNREPANVMHIDLNSAFAMTEQQAHPSLRGKPVAVTNRLTKGACVIAASYEAKIKGVKVGMRFDEAKMRAPNLVMLESDPPKYHHVYQKLVVIMKSYSPHVKMKSIDEGIIDFHDSRRVINTRPLSIIGHEIKRRVRAEIGDFMTVNVGIAPNRFLAKLAAGLHKPDGLDVITHKNLRRVLSSLQLTDLPGIAQHYEARLNAHGIYTPLQFLDASSDLLRRGVFRSVVGEDWYRRLRGFEADNVVTRLGNVGRQYVLDVRTTDEEAILARFQHLCESTGKKLRHNQVDARGVLVWLHFNTGESWYKRHMFKTAFYTDKAVFERALFVFNQRPKHLLITTMGITCYQLSPSARGQASILESVNKEAWLTEAVDEINERYGTFVVTAANSMAVKSKLKQKIPFGSTKYFELLLK